MNFVQTLKTCFNFWKKKDLHCKNKDFKDKSPLPWNLYDMRTVGEARHEFYKVHLYFKLWLIYPFIHVAKWIFRNSWEVNIPKENYNRNFFVFDRAYEKSIRQWFKFYIFNKVTTRGVSDEKLEKEISNPNSILRIIKVLFYKLILTDTVYREFFNMLMFNLYGEMFEEYKNDKEINHLLFTSKDVSDITYYVMDKVISKENQDLSKPFTVYLRKTGNSKKV